MLEGFKKFILRGNVVDLAVGIAVGAAFGAVVTSLVVDIFTPIIGAIAKVPDLSGWFIPVNGSKIMLGNFANRLISFLIVSIVIYFAVVLPVNALISRSKKGVPADPTTKRCPYCDSEISLQATRCPFCTSELKD